jgi:periplasmic copper chaperone A
MKFSTMLAAGLIALFANGAFAHDYKLGALEIGDPWSRATPKSADTAAGYLTIKNTGSTPDRLVSATFSDAATAQIHQMSMDNGVMKMREVANGLEIKPGEMVELKPQSFHIMFMGLKGPLVKGQTVKGTLTFEKAGTIDVEFAVQAAGSPGPREGGQMQHDHMQMEHMQMDHMH